MVKIFLASGYNSWTHKRLTRVFRAPSEAEQFVVGLTDAKVYMLTGKDNFEAFNRALDSVEFLGEVQS